MSDADIVEMYNEILDAQWRVLQQWDKTVVEEPPGEKQIDYHADSYQSVPRADVLRCIIDDGGPNGEVIIQIDDQELSLAEFGRLLQCACWMGNEDCFRSRGVRHRESEGRNPKARAAEALTRQQAQAVYRRNREAY